MAPRTTDQIRDDLLEHMQDEHRAIGQRIVTTPRSPHFVLATAIALEIEGAEAEAAAARREAFPSTASEEGVLQHADAAGNERIEPVRAVLRVRVTGTPSAVLPVPAGKQLTSAAGLVFLAAEGNVAFNSGGVAFVAVTARDAGVAGNLADGAVLTWQGAPAGFAPTATAMAAPGDSSHVLVVGADLETIEELRTRTALWWKERRQGGNRADWHGWLEEVEGVGDGFVWPRAWLDGGVVFRAALPGVMVTAVLAPPPPAGSYTQQSDGSLGLGLAPSYSRVASPELRERVRRYIEGTHDRAGVPLPTALQRQRRPSGIAAQNWLCAEPVTMGVDLTVAIDADPAVAPWPWGLADSPVRVVTAATASVLTLDSAVGIPAGSRVAVQVGTGVIRGGFWLARIVGAPVGNVVTLASPLPVVPVAGAQVRPDGGLWGDVRARVLGVVDHLGPGDDASIESQRYPRPADHAPELLYASRLIAAVQELAGVTGVTVTLPLDAVVPVVADRAPLKLVVPGLVRVVPG
jgi:uncharacterized phage protein gp47/JayE